MQAELLILRLSRSSGVLGLAGMAFTSQLFSSSTILHYFSMWRSCLLKYLFPTRYVKQAIRNRWKTQQTKAHCMLGTGSELHWQNCHHQGFDSLIHQKFLIYAFQSPLPWYCRALDTGVALVLMVSCAFKPRVPLGGGHSSYL
ncbi:hypothetical protein LINPERHAP2_LOCUS2769 [Linum perenne]